jgi:hypothetical protein
MRYRVEVKNILKEISGIMNNMEENEKEGNKILLKMVRQEKQKEDK